MNFAISLLLTKYGPFKHVRCRWFYLPSPCLISLIYCQWLGWCKCFCHWLGWCQWFYLSL